MLWDLLHFLHRMHWRYSPTASPYSSNMVAACCCYALRSTQLSNILASLMLRSKICASFFQASTIIECYALRSSLQSPNIIDATDLQFSIIIDATLKDFLFKFPTSAILHSKIFSSIFHGFPTLLMLRFQIFSSLFRHHQCCTLRSSFGCSHILPALMLCFSIFCSFFSHCTIIDAML